MRTSERAVALDHPLAALRIRPSSSVLSVCMLFLIFTALQMNALLSLLRFPSTSERGSTAYYWRFPWGS